MDLLATVRKEGSRGGQGDFKWSDVQNSTRREHYLGHSLMAPVGRWAKGRDLSWYAKADDGADGEDPTAKAARERKEEIQLIKQAEEDALARALGLPVPDRNNANLQPVSDKREVEKILKEGAAGDDETGRGIGYGTRLNAPGVTEERLEGNAESGDKELQYALKEYRRRHNDRENRRRDDNRERRHGNPREHRSHHRRHGSRDRRNRSRDKHRSPSRDGPRRHRSRSRSPRRSNIRDRHRARSRS